VFGAEGLAAPFFFCFSYSSDRKGAREIEGKTGFFFVALLRCASYWGSIADQRPVRWDKKHEGASWFQLDMERTSAFDEWACCRRSKQGSIRNIKITHGFPDGLDETHDKIFACHPRQGSGGRPEFFGDDRPADLRGKKVSLRRAAWVDMSGATSASTRGEFPKFTSWR